MINNDKCLQIIKDKTIGYVYHLNKKISLKTNYRLQTLDGSVNHKKKLTMKTNNSTDSVNHLNIDSTSNK
jgi:hypothetical protein